MATTCYVITMLTFLSNSLLTLYTLISLSKTVSSSESSFYVSKCSSADTFIDCSGRQFAEVPSDLPTWTKVLKLNKNMLTDMPNFTQAFNLSQLMLGHNQLTSISRTSLENMPNIEILEMNNNELAKVNANDFPLLTKLENLNLNHNAISKIENGSFNGLINLSDLKLNRNKLSQLNEDMFKNLTSLRTLELNKNLFTKIGWPSFQGLDALLVLKLRQNAIDDIADGAFFKLWNLRELHLDYNKLTKVDKGWLYGLNALSYLNVSNNRIQILNKGWESCSHLKELDLSNNYLESIQRLTFEHLIHLELLKLDNNRISYIEDGAFESLSSLQILDLSYNHVSWIVENTNGAFTPLKELNKLLLAGNNIFHISNEAFLGLDSVVYIDLLNNTVSSIEENPFKNLPKLKEVLINSSSLICDCSMKWYGLWLPNTSIQLKPGNLSCIHPPNLIKKPVHAISQKDFVCVPSDHPLPRVTIHPEPTISYVGSNITLRCGANSSIDSEMTFMWKMNHHRLENVPTKRYESAQNQGVMQFSDLLLTSVTMSQSGLYQCVVSNGYGVAYSKHSQLSVLVFPSFVKTPSNVVTKVGSTAKLDCSASGFPTPRISWQKDGGLSFPAATEKRMQIMSPDEPFFIVNVKLIDAGMYTCTARNSAGTITTNATLTVLEPPTFHKEMKNKEVKFGDAVVLECMAAGSPKPKITWTKDGKSVTLTKRHYLAADDQLLFISDTMLADVGTYECELSNTLGYVRGRSKLVVLSEHYNGDKDEKGMKEINNEVVIGIVISTFVLSVVITSTFWVIVIYLTRKNRRTIHTPLSPIDSKSENSSHSSKDSGTGDSTKRSYQDLLITTANTNHSSIMHGNHSESPSPVPESTLPLLTTFHPISVDGSTYKDGTCTKNKHHSSMTPVHYQSKPSDHGQGIFCASPASSNGVQCACLTATFKKKAEMCDCFANSSPVKHNCVVNHCNSMTTEHDGVSCYGDVAKRPCSIPVPYHTGHPVSANCCRHHPNSYLCLYVPPGQHNVPQ